MKAAPVLALTTALSLGGVILLFLKQQDLAERLSSTSRSSAPRAGSEPDAVATERLVFLEAELRRLAAAVHAQDPATPAATTPGGAAAAPAAEPGRAADVPAADAPGTQADLPAPAMEVFRRHVRRALELNGEEDQGRRVVEQLDRLVERSAIGAMTATQKERAAKTILTAQRKLPDVWRKVFADAQGRELPREQRVEMVRVEVEALRAEAQKELETIVPAADAKKIAEETLGGGPGRMAFLNTGEDGFGGRRQRTGG